MLMCSSVMGWFVIPNKIIAFLFPHFFFLDNELFGNLVSLQIIRWYSRKSKTYVEILQLFRQF